MKTINELTGVDFEDTIDNVATTLVFTVPIVRLIEAADNLAKTNLQNFVENYKTYLGTVTNSATETELDNFANGVYNNINIKLV